MKKQVAKKVQAPKVPAEGRIETGGSALSMSEQQALAQGSSGQMRLNDYIEMKRIENLKKETAYRKRIENLEMTQ